MYSEIVSDVFQVNLMHESDHFVELLLREKTFHE